MTNSLAFEASIAPRRTNVGLGANTGAVDVLETGEVLAALVAAQVSRNAELRALALGRRHLRPGKSNMYDEEAKRLRADPNCGRN